MFSTQICVVGMQRVKHVRAEKYFVVSNQIRVETLNINPKFKKKNKTMKFSLGVVIHFSFALNSTSFLRRSIGFFGAV